MTLPVTTVVAVPFSSHLRTSGQMNAQAALVVVNQQITEMVSSLSLSLLALSGRVPAECIDNPEFVHLRAASGHTGLRASTEPHWLWQYLTSGIQAHLAVVTAAAYRQELVRRGWPILEDQSTPRKLVFESSAGIKEQPIMADAERLLVRQDFRDRTKAEVWKAAKLAAGVETITTELSLGDGAIASLAGWIASRSEPPAGLKDSAPDKAEALPGLIQQIFRKSGEIAEAWRILSATHGAEPLDSANVRAQVRRATQASVYEALKAVTSWVTLDRQAAALKMTRSQALTTAMEISPVGRERTDQLLSAIEDRAAARRRADPTAVTIDLLSFDWKACSAIMHFMDTGVLAYENKDEKKPWSHPDWESFWSAFSSERDAIGAFVMISDAIEGEERQSIAELARVWKRAHGYARYTASSQTRVHVDWSSAGTRGSLEVAVDATEPSRSRQQNDGTPVILASFQWLGQVHPLRFHIGNDRALTAQKQATSWTVSYRRNRRRPENELSGEAKTFDVAIIPEQGIVRLTLPIQTEVKIGDPDTTAGFARGGWFRRRPTDEPRQPDGMKTKVPDAGRVMAIDIGISPVVGWSVLEKAGEKIHCRDEGALGIGFEALIANDQFSFHHPDFTFQRSFRLLRTAERMRAWLRARSRATTTPRTLSAIDTNGLLSDSVRETATAVPIEKLSVIPKALTALITAIPEAAVACADTSSDYLIGHRRIRGRQQPATLAEGVDQVLHASLAVIQDPDVRSVARVLLAPMAWYLLAYQRQRVCRSEMCSHSKKDHLTNDQVTQRRNDVAVKHGYQNEAYFHQLSLFIPNTVPLFQRPSAEAEGLSLQAQLISSDFSEAIANLGASLAGWGQAPLPRGAVPEAHDPRAHWNDAYGFLRTRAANTRVSVHRTISARMVEKAATHQVRVLAIENLTLTTTSRADKESNGLTRRLAARDWQTMILRAADLAGVATVLVDPAWTSHELVPVSANGSCDKPVFVANDDHLSSVAKRTRAARAIAYRSITGWEKRTRFAVQVSAITSDGSRFARLRAPLASGPKIKYAVWQQRFSRADDTTPERMLWRIQNNGHVEQVHVLPEELKEVIWESRGDTLCWTQDGYQSQQHLEKLVKSTRSR